MNSRALFPFALVVALTAPSLSFAADDKPVVYVKESLYKAGFKAYAQDKDYITALKNLFAFQELNEAALEKLPAFAKTVHEAIADCETHLRREQKWGYGGTASVVTSSSGGATPVSHFIDAKGHAINPSFLKKFQIDYEALSFPDADAAPVVVLGGKDAKVDENAVKKGVEALRKALGPEPVKSDKKD